jgi:hypothetical protein
VTTFPLPPDAAEYLAAVRARLADLPADERDDLLADLETSLIEEPGEGTVSARLGPPERFADELRAAAGLQPGIAAPRGPGIRERLAALAAHPRVAAARGWLVELAPIWWLVRAYVAAGLVALVAGIGWSAEHPELPRFSSATGTTLVLAALVGASLWLGVRSRRHPGEAVHRRVRLAVNAVLAVALLPVALHVWNGRARFTEVIVSEPAPPQPGLTYNGAPVTNLYPYARSGRLLQDVLIYDGSGQPIDVGVGVADPDRRVLVTAAGSRVFNSFPIRYFEPRTTLVAHPYASPPVALPNVLTPPLAPRRTS